MAAARGIAVYGEAIYQLCHLRFVDSEAGDHWREILARRAQMTSRLGEPVDLRVALISYFLHVQPKLHHPKIVEWLVFEHTRESVYRDELTGLYNYRFFEESLNREIARARQGGHPVSLVMIDLDHFKEFNDRRGHDSGNALLQRVGELLGSQIRQPDVAARYGGEEFALVLPATPKRGAHCVAERVRAELERRRHGAREGTSELGVTASCGVATFSGDADDAAGLIRAADQALYLAKAAGRNRVELHGHSSRSHRRVAVALPGAITRTAESSEPVTAVRLSEGGVLLELAGPLDPGQLVDLLLELSDGGAALALACRVVGVGPLPQGGYSAAARIVDLDVGGRRRLSLFLNGRASAD